MYEFVKCPSCNKSIGEFYELFIRMKQLKMKLLKNDKDKEEEFNCQDIFEILNITCISCRGKFTMTKIFNETLYENPY